ncbi:TPA: hypothetical protein VDU83_002713 [Pseudomonas aeruginosa]|nr:hypothetical protein [Pseudomonas aeruginosa]
MSRAAAWREELPPALRGAQLVLSESELSTEVPVPMHGRGDQVYLANGWLVPVDTKRRSKAVVYFKDIIQLSAYGFILSRASTRLFGQNLPVATHGFVRLVVGRQVSYVPVKLLSSTQVISLWNRYWELKRKKARPAIPEAYKCAQCPKKNNCPVGRRR